jgi:hypothetical protein
MKTIWMTLAVLTATAAITSGCTTAPTEADDEVASDEAAYVVWQRSASCLVKKSLAPSIKICVTGWGDLARSRALTENALRQWLDAVRPLNAGVTSTIVFGCDAPDGRVHVDNRGEYSMPADVYVNNSSAQGTYIRELGHAFACLGDTYVGRTAGACMSGQPHSVMCDGLLRNDLSADDIAGVRAQFRALVGGGPPPPPADPNDLDGDGIANADDLCPNTPTGSHIWRDQLGGVWKGCAYGQTRPRR